jgi:hypothetical protein
MFPATLCSIGCFYAFGSLEPSERTFLGVIPMLTSTNPTMQALKVARLKGRLPAASVPSST